MRAGAAPVVGPACTACGRDVAEGRGFRIGGTRRCLGCTLRFRPLLWRSLFTALVVGTALTAINQGPELLAGQVAPALLWKIPLTYLVPFLVSTWGALSNGRS